MTGRRRYLAWLGLAGAIAISACTHQERPAAQTKTAAVRPAARVMAASEDVWHLRIGLNVAALSCRGRGREPVAAAYQQMLSRHAALMNAAHAAEQKRYGEKAYDRHATQLYNRFANQRSATKFCSTAAEVARRAGAMTSLALNHEASGMLGQLRRWAG